MSNSIRTIRRINKRNASLGGFRSGSATKSGPINTEHARFKKSIYTKGGLIRMPIIKPIKEVKV